MFRNTTYKQRVMLFAAGCIIFLIVVYSLAIKQTIATGKKYKHLKKDIAQAADAPQMIKELEKKITFYDNLLGNQQDLSRSFREVLLDYISNYCQQNKVVLKNFPSSHEYISNNFIIETSIVVLEGPFCNLLTLLHQLETKPGLGKVQSTAFESYTNIRTKRKVLHLTLYLQNIKNTRNEK